MNNLQAISNGIKSQAVKAEMIESFISYLDTTPKTVETYKKALKQLFNYLQENGITEPMREDLIAFKAELMENHKATTIQSYFVAIRRFFKWTEYTGIYPNIAEGIKGAKISKEHKKDSLTSQMCKNILGSIYTDSEAGLRDYAIISLMMCCGLRTVEVARANIEDLRTLGDNTVLYVQGKGQSEKAEFVKVPDAVEKAIRAYLILRGEKDETKPLFTSTSNNSRGKRLTTRAISGITKCRMIEAGYDSDRITAHSLRHTAVTLALLAGARLDEVQQFARHANISTTMIYNHAIEKAKNTCSNSIAGAIF